MKTTIIFFVLFLVYFFLYNRKDRDSKIHPISRDSSNCLKGIMALAVVLHHLAQMTDVLWARFLFYDFGTVAVGCFFFISGYGLIASYEAKGRAYLTGFPLKRLRKLIIPFLFVIILFQLINREQADLLHSLAIGDVSGILPCSWYVFCAILFYFVFYIVFKLVKDEMQGIVWLFIFVCVLSGILFVIHWPKYWYSSLLLFPVGAFLKKEENYLTSKKIRMGICMVTSMVVLMACLYMYNQHIGHILCHIAPLVYVLVLMVINVSFKPLKWLGNISYEIYLLQGVVFYVLQKFIHNEQYFIILSLICIIILAYIVKSLLNKLDVFMCKNVYKNTDRKYIK